VYPENSNAPCSRPKLTWADGRSQAKGDRYAVWLQRRIRQSDFTLRGLVAELAKRGLEVDYRSVWEFVQAEKLSLKKA
jgi:transposase